MDARESTAGESCSPDHPCGGTSLRCDYPDNLCGRVASGTCTLRFCRADPTVFVATCGCDGVTYQNVCFSELGGTDANAPGGCAPPSFDPSVDAPCGYTFCTPHIAYCLVHPRNGGGLASSYDCLPVPFGQCGSAPGPSCACLGNVCGDLGMMRCDDRDPDRIVVTCG
jgi:hypothetical protein